MKGKKYWKEIFGALLLIGFNIFIFADVGKKNVQFWNFNFLTLASFDFAAIISFYVAQKIGSSRRKNDFIVQSIYELEEMLDYKNNCDVSSPDTLKSARLYQRTISNRLETLKKYSPKYIKQEIKFAIKKFDEYRERFDDNMADQSLIDGQKLEFQRLESDLKNIFFDMKIKIYDEMF